MTKDRTHVSTDESNRRLGMPLPRTARSRHRSKLDRGLASDAELEKLASTYLDMQRSLWPNLAKNGTLPEASPSTMRAMVEDFKKRHRTGQVDPSVVAHLLLQELKLGGNYDRYSCANSKPTSILDQMVRSLRCAQEKECFIPWVYVFADYSISGLDSSRRGYTSYKSVLKSKDHKIATTFIDDFTRMSRDEMEWWKLANASRSLGKGLIGASDGFDIKLPNCEVLISIYSLLSRLFIKGLREKVRRGMSGAASRGTCIGRLPLGFTRAAMLDPSGGPMLAPDGKPVHVLCIDPSTSEAVRLAFRLFTEDRWSALKICRHFNSLRVDNSEHWAEDVIKKILRNPAYIGVFIWNRRRSEKNFETDKWEWIRNPRSEWLVRYDRSLQIIPMEHWRAAKKKLAEMRRRSPNTGKKQSRNECNPTTLVSGTLFCEYCHAELLLYRSCGNHKQVFCLNGRGGVHGCKLTTSKSARIIEQEILDFVQRTVLNADAIDKLVPRANAALEAEAKRPAVDTAPLRTTIRSSEARIKKLVRQIEEEEDNAMCQAYHYRVKELQGELNAARRKLAEAERSQRALPPPLDAEILKGFLADLRGLLNREIPVAAQALRALTGPITIRQEKCEGQTRGSTWIATFAPDFIRFVAEHAKNCNHATSSTLDHVCRSEGVDKQQVSLRIESIPPYRQLTAKAMKLKNEGLSDLAIAAALAVGVDTVRAALGKALPPSKAKPRPKRKRSDAGGKRRIAVYKQISEAVVQLRDVERKTFEAIAKSLGVAVPTAVRAYDAGRPDLIQAAVDNGEPPRRSSRSRMGRKKLEMLQAMLAAKAKTKDIVAKLGCSRNTVTRARLVYDRSIA